jgi:ABC-2 type transport system permease protein
MDYMSLYFDFIKIKLKGMTEYPGAFWAESIAKMMGWAANLIIIYLMVFRFENVLGWSAYEVLMLYSINATSYALAGFLMFNAFGTLSRHIQMGTFDEMLTKPMNPFFYLCFKGFSTGYIGNLISTVTAMIVCIVKLNIPMSFINIFYLVIIIAGSTLIHSGMFMLANIPVFWIVKADALLSFRWALDEFIRYPISIYDRWIQIMLTFILPIAFVNFYPIQYFLQKDDFLGFSSTLTHLTPVIGVILFALGYMFFFVGIKNYKSTGS